jgi:hypothetical protein
MAVFEGYGSGGEAQSRTGSFAEVFHFGDTRFHQGSVFFSCVPSFASAVASGREGFLAN